MESLKRRLLSGQTIAQIILATNRRLINVILGFILMTSLKITLEGLAINMPLITIRNGKEIALMKSHLLISTIRNLIGFTFGLLIYVCNLTYCSLIITLIKIATFLVLAGESVSHSWSRLMNGKIGLLSRFTWMAIRRTFARLALHGCIKYPTWTPLVTHRRIVLRMRANWNTLHFTAITNKLVTLRKNILTLTFITKVKLNSLVSRRLLEHSCRYFNSHLKQLIRPTLAPLMLRLRSLSRNKMSWARIRHAFVFIRSWRFIFRKLLSRNVVGNPYLSLLVGGTLPVGWASCPRKLAIHLINRLGLTQQTLSWRHWRQNLITRNVHK